MTTAPAPRTGDDSADPTTDEPGTTGPVEPSAGVSEDGTDDATVGTDGEPVEPGDHDEPGAPDGAEASDRPAGRRSSITAGELEKEGEIAADYLEDLLDIADVDGDIDMDVERDRALVSVVGGDLDHLVGRNGTVLEALQELTRLAVHAQTGNRSRLMLDVGGYRAGRKAVLTELGRTTADGVRASGEKERLEPMSPFERKVVHDAVAAAGLRSESEGEEPHRRVVVLPA